ncbi:MAG: ImuA protein [Pseudolabrys sp.]|nr:ImuA protein [Pseudolabrys sp.]
MKSPPVPLPAPRRAELVGALRRLLPRMEGVGQQGRALSFGIPALDLCLPQRGLVFGALHEIVPATEGDRPAAIGFLVALLGRMPAQGPVLLVAAPRGWTGSGRPYGRGLHQLGLDPARVLLVAAGGREQALGAMEDALRSGVPAAVAGAVDRLDLRASQRLQLAARETGIPLLLLRQGPRTEASVAMTRWRVGAAPAARDRFGLFARWRWRLQLERCRNGRTGAWVVEFDDAYRFSLAAAMADPALPRRAGAQSLARAG